MLLKVRTNYGVVTGCIDNGAVSFRGIPFAKPPVGELRFMPPEKPDSWEGERDCSHFAPGCFSGRAKPDAAMSEDCLYLNVWTTAESAEEKRPVMVWIYGGGFQDGSGADPMFNGSRLSKNGVVSVTFNYRSGVLGFFAHPELAKRQPSGTSGNYGLLDMIAALTWVKENISAFGGDPDNVLIFGQSAGGISCRILLTSKLAHGLFSKVIVQSGGGINEADPFRSEQELSDIGQKALDLLGWKAEDLLTRDGEEVYHLVQKAAVEALDLHVPGIFQPCLDGYVIEEIPGVRIRNGEYDENIDIICGSVCGDSWMFCREVSDAFGTDDQILRPFSYSPQIAWAENQVKGMRKPIYTYYMEKKQPPMPPRPGKGPSVYRYGLWCSHGSEIPYVFGTLDVKSDQFDRQDREISEKLMKYWTDFAKEGVPGGAERSDEWPAYTAASPVTLHISDNGITTEKIVDSEKAVKVIEFVRNNPGMLESLDRWEIIK